MPTPPFNLSAGPSVTTSGAQGGRIFAPFTVGSSDNTIIIIAVIAGLTYYFSRLK